MVLNARALVLLHILVWSLPGTFSLSSGSLSDISCLKSITDSLEDPLVCLDRTYFAETKS